MVSLAVFMGLLTVLQVSFRLYSDELVGVVLREIVTFKSEGMYSLSYDDLRLNFIGNSLEIDNLRLKPDSGRYYNEETRRWRVKNKVYEVQVPSVRVKGTDLLGAYLEDKVNLKRIHVHSPQVRIYSHDTVSQVQPYQISNLFFLISDRLTVFSIHDFQINDARVAIYQSLPTDSMRYYEFSDISLSAENFQIDSLSSLEGKPFRVDDISIESKRNSFQIPGTNYMLEVDALSASTKAKTGKVVNLRVIPVFGELGESFYEIKVPSLQLEDIDFQKAYFEQLLRVGKVSLKALQTNVFSLSNKKIAFAEKSPYELVSDYFKSVHIRQIQLDSSSFSVARGGVEDLSYPFDFKSITLSLYNFFLDSATQQQRRNRFFLDDFHVTFRDYKFFLPDSVHALKANRLTVSSRDSLIIADSLLVFPRADRRQYEKYRFTLPAFRLSGADLWDAYLKKSLIADRLEIRGGDLQLRGRQSGGAGKGWRQFGEVLSAQGIQAAIREVKLQNLNFALRYPQPTQNIQVRGLWLTLHDFELFPPPGALPNASYLHLVGQRFSLPDRYGLHRIIGESFEVSSGRNQVILEGLRWEPSFPTLRLARLDTVPKQLIRDIKIGRITLSDFDLLEAYNTGDIRAGTLLVESPDLTVFRHENAVASVEKDSLWQKILLDDTYLKSVNLDKINIRKGAFSLVNFGGQAGIQRTLSVDDFSLFASNFCIDSLTRKQDYLFFQSDSLSIHLSDYLFYLPDKRHVMEAEELEIVSDRGHVKDLYLLPLGVGGDGQRKNQYKVHIPHLMMRGLNFTKLLFQRELEVDTLEIPSPYVELSFVSKERKPSQVTKTSSLRLDKRVRLSNLHDLVKSSLHKLIIHQALVDSLQFRWANWRRGRKNTFNADNIRLEIEEFILDSSARMTNERILYANDIRVHVDCYEQIMPDSTHQITWNNGVFSSKSSNLSLKNIQLIPLQKPPDRNHYQLFVPELHLRGMRLLDAYTQEALHLDALELNKPQIFAAFRSKSGRKKRQKGLIDFQQVDSLYHYLSPFFDRYYIGTLQLDSAELDLELKNPKAQVFFPLENFSARLKGFRLPRLATDSALFFSDYIALRVPYYRVPLRDTLHQLEFSDLKLRSDYRSLEARALHWTPLQSPYDYTKAKPYETDWIQMRLPEMAVFGLDWKRLLGKKEFDIQRIRMQGMHLRAFRDKSRPDKPQGYKALPHDRLTETSEQIRIDTLELLDMYAAYTEHPERGTRAGTIFFDSLQAQLYNISNFTEDADTSLLAYVHTRIMGQGKMNARLSFPLNDNTEDYTLEGSMDTLDMTHLNPLLEPIIAIRINKGIAENLQFSVKADDTVATGRMLFRYRKLKVKVLDKLKYKAGVEELFASFAANVVVRNRNPRPLLKFKEGEVYFERNQGKSIFNYWAKIFLSGIKSSVGLGN